MNRLKKIGTVKKFASKDVASSRIGIGFEKLDRGVFDPNKAYDKVAALGVKWARLQSGWARTEKEKGVYDFAWLDEIVDNLLRRGLQPWMCLCYGNGLYSPKAQEVFGAVGVPPMFTEEERRGWHNYVAAVTRRYAGKIQWYEVWNEPDGRWCWKHGVSGTEYGEFVKQTAAAIKEGDPNAKVIGGSYCTGSIGWLAEVFATGAGAVMDGLTYHAYNQDETNFARVRAIRALAHSYNPQIAIIQGETGTQSRDDGAGALRGMAWTQETQAKYIARHMAADLLEDVMFASYFSCMDMIEALNGTVGDKASYLDYGYFGVLGAEFDENGNSTGAYNPKPAYYTLQTVASVFQGDFSVCDLPVQFRTEHSNRYARETEKCFDLVYGGFRRPNGSSAFVYWKPTPLITSSCRSVVSFDAHCTAEPRLVDLLNGNVYEFPESMKRHDLEFRAAELTPEQAQKSMRDSAMIIAEVPLLDTPLLLTFGDFVEIDKI